MTHEPPVPPDNQSPYPIAEPPHEHHPEPPEPEADAEVEDSAGSPRILLIGGAIATAGLAAIGGLTAILLRRRSKAGPKPKSRPTAKRKK
jgi:hypothetical protein